MVKSPTTKQTVNTTIVITKETFDKFNQIKHDFLVRIADNNGGMVPRINNDQFISVLLNGLVTSDKTLT